jgi:hypothetical protein
MLHSRVRRSAVALVALGLLAGPVSAAPLAQDSLRLRVVSLFDSFRDSIQSLWSTAWFEPGRSTEPAEQAPNQSDLDKVGDHIDEGCGIDPSGGCAK